MWNYLFYAVTKSDCIVKNLNNVSWRKTTKMAEDSARTNARVQYALDILSSVLSRAKSETVFRTISVYNSNT